jgi:hypothetical protein
MFSKEAVLSMADSSLTREQNATQSGKHEHRTKTVFLLSLQLVRVTGLYEARACQPLGLPKA